MKTLPRNSKQVISSLLRQEIPDRIGFNESFWPHILENAWLDQGIPKDVDFTSYFDLDIRPCTWISLPGPCPHLDVTLKEDSETLTKRNAWGSITRMWKNKAGTPEHVGFYLDNPDKWFNEFRKGVIAIQPKDCFDGPNYAKNLALAKEENRFSTASSQFIFEWLRLVLGDQYMLESLLTEEEMIHDFNQVFTDKFIEIFDYAFKTYGKPDGVHIYEDLGYTRSAFASPDCHREMVLPYHKQFFGFFKAQGLPIIMHTCGDFRVHLDSIYEAGVDCIQALEAKTGMDVADMSEIWKGKMCFMGNLDIRALESGDREKMRLEIESKVNRIRAMKAPYIFMSDHSIPPSVTVDDYKYCVGLYKKLAHY